MLVTPWQHASRKLPYSSTLINRALLLTKLFREATESQSGDAVKDMNGQQRLLIEPVRTKLVAPIALGEKRPMIWGYLRFCAGQRIEAGKSLADLFPELAKEYDLAKNSESPYSVFTKTNKKYWWTCVAGHSYKRKVIDRTSFGRGCPECNLKNADS